MEETFEQLSSASVGGTGRRSNWRSHSLRRTTSNWCRLRSGSRLHAVTEQPLGGGNLRFWDLVDLMLLEELLADDVAAQASEPVADPDAQPVETPSRPASSTSSTRSSLSRCTGRRSASRSSGPSASISLHAGSMIRIESGRRVPSLRCDRPAEWQGGVQRGADPRGTGDRERSLAGFDAVEHAGQSGPSSGVGGT